MNTKQKILQQSKVLFNTHGFQKTTLRQIALSLSMSQGNLNYHFRTKNEIIESLYFELVEKLNIEMSTMTRQFSMLSALYQSAEKTMHIFYDYRFLLRDMYLIFRENHKIRDHYSDLQKTRNDQFKSLFESMISQEILRKEEFSKEYERLYERMSILGDNWINVSELLPVNAEDPAAYYQDLLFEMIYPYLTAKGKEEYVALFS